MMGILNAPSEDSDENAQADLNPSWALMSGRYVF